MVENKKRTPEELQDKTAELVYGAENGGGIDLSDSQLDEVAGGGMGAPEGFGLEPSKLFRKKEIPSRGYAK